MPVTVPLYLHSYAAARVHGTLDVSGVSCPRVDCECSLQLTASTVLRTVIVVGRDEHGCQQIVRLLLVVAIARGTVCKGRFRVLPADVLPRKLYALDVIGLLVSIYGKGELSLRAVAWMSLPGKTPVHSTLHAWTEGAGAYVGGRQAGEVADALPAGRILAEAEARHPAARRIRRTGPNVDVSPRRYRTPARRDRLAACQVLLLCALAIAGAGRFALVELNRLILTWCGSRGIGFRTGLTCTSVEQVGKELMADSPPSETKKTEESGCEIRTRSPPSAASRSSRFSTKA